MVWLENCMVWSEIVWFQIMNLMVWAGSGVGKSGYESIGCYTYYVTFSYDFDLGFWRSNLKKALVIGIRGWVDMEPIGCESVGCWTQVLTSNFDLTHDIGNSLWYSNMGRSVDLPISEVEFPVLVNYVKSIWFHSEIITQGQFNFDFLIFVNQSISRYKKFKLLI